MIQIWFNENGVSINITFYKETFHHFLKKYTYIHTGANGLKICGPQLRSQRFHNTKLWPLICKKTDIGDSDIWQPVYHSQEGDSVSILQEALMALGLAWMGAENLTPHHPLGIKSQTIHPVEDAIPTTLPWPQKIGYIIKLRFYTYF
jgi:hypothetical protein